MTVALGYSAAQMRLLHRLAAARGLSHEDLRACAGVGSLTELTGAHMARLIDRLALDRPQPRYRFRRGRQPLLPGEIRLTSDATSRQRRTVLALLADLGWSPETCANWLMQRHRIRDVEHDPIPRSSASEIIEQLRAAFKKTRPAAASRAAPVPAAVPENAF